MRQARGEDQAEPATKPALRAGRSALAWPFSNGDAKTSRGLRLRRRRMSLITDTATRRSERDRLARRQLEDEYREHAATVDRYLAGTCLLYTSPSPRDRS